MGSGVGCGSGTGCVAFDNEWTEIGSRNFAAAPASSESSEGDCGSQIGSPPSLSAHFASPPSSSFRAPPVGRSPDKICAGLDGPRGRTKDINTLAYDESHQLRRSRGYTRENSKVVLIARLSTMDALGRE